VQAHGILHRPSEDVDLFTAWERRDEFAAAVNAVVATFREHGYAVEVTQQLETFARLAVTDPARPDQTSKVELAANWRAQPPVVMDVGPVLHPDDVVAGNTSALFTRAEPRDFLDVDAAITSGRYSRERLCELAEQADAGFDRRILADLFGVLERYPDRRFAAYGATPSTWPSYALASPTGAANCLPARSRTNGVRVSASAVSYTGRTLKDGRPSIYRRIDVPHR
jgi:hypothetical protein